MKQKKIKFLLGVFLLNQIAFYSFAPLYAIFARNLGATTKTVALIWSASSLLTALLIVIIGRFENRLNKGKMITFGYLIYTISSIFLLFADSKETLFVALAIGALGGGVTFPAYKTMFAKNESRGRESEEWAWLDASNMLAASAGAAIGGFIVAAFGFEGLFITMASIQFIATLVAYKYFYHSA